MRQLRCVLLCAVVCASPALAGCFESPGTCETDADCFAGEICNDGVCRSSPDSSSPTDTDAASDVDTDRVDSSDTGERDPSDSADTRMDGTETGPSCVDDADCTGPEQCCSNACVDPMSNNSHCGGCSNTCPDSESCVEGTCEPDSCTADARCPEGSDTVVCVGGECRARTCRGSRHPCDEGRKCCDWTSHGVVAQPGYRTGITIAYDSDDRRLLAYWQELDGERSKRVVKLAESNAGPPMWSTSKVSETTPAGYGLSLAVDSGDDPHLIYSRTSDGTDELRWARRKSSIWKRTSPATGVTSSKWALTLDPSDTPHAVFRRGSDAAYGTGTGSWDIRKLGTINSMGSSDGLEIDSDGLPHLVFRDDNDKVVYERKTSSSGWMTEDIHTKDQSFSADLELDSSDDPEVAFSESTSKKVVFAERKSGGTWQKTKLSDKGENVRLVIDGDGTRRVYFLTPNGNDTFAIREARRIDGNWRVKTLKTESDNLIGNDLDVALSSEGRPGIAYTVEKDVKFMEW